VLTDIQIKRAKPGEKLYKLADSHGLFLAVLPSGAKSFRLKYRFAGKEKVLTFGVWPIVTLAMARERALDAKRLLLDNIDPATEKRAAKAATITQAGDTLEIIAREWHAKQKRRWAERQHNRFIASLAADAFPRLGVLPVASITPAMVAGVLNAVEGRGALEEAHRLRRRLDVVFAYAVATGRASVNPAAGLKGTLTNLVQTNKQPAALTIDEARDAYAALLAYPATLETRGAMQMVALTAARPGNVRAMEWREIEEATDGPIWRIPGDKLKGTIQQKAERGRDHVVPLSAAAVAVLEAMRPMTGHGRYAFPSPRTPNRPLSDMALSVLCQRAGLGGRHVPHGWRASFSTLMNERHPELAGPIDAALGHTVRGVEGRYNRSAHLILRRQLFDEWATMLAELAKGQTHD
jgi:integrase